MKGRLCSKFNVDKKVPTLRDDLPKLLYSRFAFLQASLYLVSYAFFISSLLNRKKRLLFPSLPGTNRATFTAVRSRISQPLQAAQSRCGYPAPSVVIFLQDPQLIFLYHDVNMLDCFAFHLSTRVLSELYYKLELLRLLSVSWIQLRPLLYFHNFQNFL